MRAPVAATVLVATAFLAAACSGGGSHPSSAPSPSSRPPAATAATPTAPTAALSWAPCAGHKGWQCANLAVPLDHAAPAGPHIQVALSRHPATGSRVAPVLINPGGPGVSGINFAYLIEGDPVFSNLFAHFDVIGFDPRGVGASTAIHCVDGPTLDRIGHADPAPATPAAVQTDLDLARVLAQGCEAHSGSLLPHVSTIDAARDMDDIRAALGETGLTYLGFSYGAYLGAMYASLFPTHIRALVLDSPLDPAVDTAEAATAQATSFEQNLNAFLSSCTSSCAFDWHRYPTARAAFDALTRSIAANPLPAGGHRTLGPGEAWLAIADPLYTPQSWPELAKGLEDAEKGNGATLMGFYDSYVGRHSDGTYDNSVEANTAINCLDHPQPTTVAGFAALAAAAAKHAPYFGPPVGWGGISCLVWPTPPVIRPGPLHAPGSPPIVVVGSTGDPATPVAWAEGLASELGNAVLVTREAEGHGAYLASDCVRQAVDDYLINLLAPRSGLVCTS